MSLPNISSLRIDCSNIQGLRSNFSEVRSHLATYTPDILFLTETQVSRGGHEFNAPKDYRMVSSFAKKHGVCAYIHPRLAYARSTKYEVNNKHFNSLIIRLNIDNNFVFMVVIYSSPNTPSNIDNFEQLADSMCCLFEEHPNAQLIITGDFNIHNAEWLKHSSHTDGPGRSAEFLASTFGLEQLVHEPTRIPRNNEFANTLDLVLSSIPDYCSVNVMPPLGTSDHCMVSTTISMVPVLLAPPPPRLAYQYSKANWQKLKTFFEEYPWRFVSSCDNVDDAVDSLTAAIKLGITLYVPVIRCTQKDTKKIVSDKAKAALREKHLAYRRYNVVSANSIRGSPTVKKARDELRSISNRCKAVLKSEEYKYYKSKTDKVLEHPNDPRFYFHTIRSLQTNFSKPSTPPLVDNGTILSDPREKCNRLASIFSNNSTIHEPTFSPPSLPQNTHCMPPIVFRKKIIYKYLSELNEHKAIGPDGVPALILKRFAKLFAPIITQIFILAYRTGKFPDTWKIANVQPIPKKGGEADINNFRPISIICVLSKVLESYINWHVLNHVEKSSILCDRQYGFRKGRSTCDVLTMLIHEWNKSLEMNGEVYAISLDVAKAFDSVWHKNLISKLKSFGLDSALITLLESFLHRRRITVVLDGYKSDLFELNAGVPQGSPLASTLFLIYINDLLSTTSNPIHSYADDTTLHASLPFRKFTNIRDLNFNRKTVIDSLSVDLQLILNWGEKNLIKFNSSKTQLCVVSRKKSIVSESVVMDSKQLKKDNALRLLGVTVNENLLWNAHVYGIAKSTAQKLGFLARCRKFFTADQSLRIYKSMIRPCIEYCSPVWGGACDTQLSILDSVQRRAVRIINDSRVTNTLDSLQHRRDVADLSLFYRYYFGLCSEELMSQVPATRIFPRVSRNSSKSHPYVVEESTCRTSHYQNDFFTRTAHKWNNLPAQLFSTPGLNAFKTNLNKHLLSLPAPRLSNYTQ